MWAEVLRSVQALPPLTQALAIAWLVTMISVPVLEWVAGDGARTAGVAAGVVLQTGTVLTILGPMWGPRATLRVAGTIIVLGWIAEFVGSHTGIPFGRYQYTSRLRPQIGRVPVLIPLAWAMMLPPAWAVGSAVAQRLGGAGWPTRSVFTIVGSLAFAAWDLFLDPQMVKWQLWLWEPPKRYRARYFGVPWSNYLGWSLVAMLITWLVSPHRLPWDSVRPALIGIYGLTWALETFGQLVFWRLPGPALAGFAGMGLFLAWAIV